MAKASDARKEILMVMACAAWTTGPGVMSPGATGGSGDTGDAS